MNSVVKPWSLILTQGEKDRSTVVCVLLWGGTKSRPCVNWFLETRNSMLYQLLETYTKYQVVTLSFGFCYFVTKAAAFG